MSGIARQQKRAALKVKYRKFCDAWNNEKRYQQYLLKNGEKLEEGHNELGCKPTFKMWMQAVENKKISQEVHQPPPAEVDDKKVVPNETDWE